MKWKYDDGGRKESGFKGKTGDCVCRAICIATGLPYKEVYNDLNKLIKDTKIFSFTRSSSRRGVDRKFYYDYLTNYLGWQWYPAMRIGSGCKVHLRADELPPGKVIVRLSKHLATVIDGVLHDTYDCSRDGTRCVYGYFRKV